MSIEAVDTRARGLRERRSSEAVGATGLLFRLDWVLLAALAALVAFGLWAIDGITMHDAGGSALSRQALYASVGAVLFIGALFIDPARYRYAWRPIYYGTLAVMLFVLAAGAATRGSRRWIDIGIFTFQPSEFGKVLFVLALAGFLAERYKRLNEPRTTLTAVGLALVPIFLVFLQPDFGSALVYCAAIAAMLFVAGTPWTHLVALAAAVFASAVLVLGALPSAGLPILKQYQQERLTSFLNPDKDPGGTTYNITQSKNAIGAGQLRGRGVDNSTQTTLNFLPEHHTDFVFASLAEERGFFGCAILLMLYLLVVWRGLRVVTLARDAFCAIVAGGLVFGMLFQIFVNVGMTMGIAPITGIPLPFVSVGGSSMIANMIAVGVLLSIHARSRRRR